jgi:hypothetical protein
MPRRTAQSIEEKKAIESTAPSRKAPPRGKDKAKRKVNPKSLANLRPKPWPKGVSGNPSGLPGTDVAALIARRAFEENPDAVYKGFVQQLANGSAYAFSVLADRGYGKVKDRHEISGPDGAPIALTVKLVKPTLKDLK